MAEHRWALVSDEDPLAHEVCALCGAQRNKDGPIAERARITGGWTVEDCERVTRDEQRRAQLLARAGLVIAGALHKAGFGEQTVVGRPERIGIAVDDPAGRGPPGPRARESAGS